MPDDINELHIFCEDFEGFFTHFAEQIGKREIFVEAEQLFPVGTEVWVVFFVLYVDLPIYRAKGAVSFHREPDPAIEGSLGGMGVKIDDADKHIPTYLMDLIKYQLRSELSRMFTT